MQIAAAQCGTSEVDGLHPTRAAFLRWIIQAYSTIPLPPVPTTICWLGNNLTITALKCVCHVLMATAATPSAFALSWNQVPVATPMTDMATYSRSFPTTQVAHGNKFSVWVYRWDMVFEKSLSYIYITRHHSCSENVVFKIDILKSILFKSSLIWYQICWSLKYLKTYPENQTLVFTNYGCKFSTKCSSHSSCASLTSPLIVMLPALKTSGTVIRGRLYMAYLFYSGRRSQLWFAR